MDKKQKQLVKQEIKAILSLVGLLAILLTAAIGFAETLSFPDATATRAEVTVNETENARTADIQLTDKGGETMPNRWVALYVKERINESGRFKVNEFYETNDRIFRQTDESGKVTFPLEAEDGNDITYMPVLAETIDSNVTFYDLESDFTIEFE